MKNLGRPLRRTEPQLKPRSLVELLSRLLGGDCQEVLHMGSINPPKKRDYGKNTPIMWAVRMRIKSPKHLIQMSKPELRRGDWAWRVETRYHYQSEGMKTPPFYGGNVCLEPQTKALLLICFF